MLWGGVLAGGFLLTAAGVAAAYFAIKTVVPAAGAITKAAALVRPTGVKATEVSGQPSGAVTISWTVPSSQPAGAVYDVYEGSSSTPLPGCTGRTTPSCAVSELTPGTTYSFSVRAVLHTWRSPPAAASVTTLGVTTSSLPGGTVHTGYAATLKATGGTKPDSWTLTAGTLPSWASLHPTGRITGTPTAPGTTSGLVVTVRDTNGVTDVSAPLSITVDAATSTLDVASAPDPSVTGQPVVFTATVLHAAGIRPTGTVSFVVTGQSGTPISCLGGTVQPLALFDHAVCIPVQPLVAADSPYAVDASYSGSATVAPSTGALTPVQTVAPDATTTILSPAARGAPDGAAPGSLSVGATADYIATVTADLPGSGAPSGTVTFTATGTGGSTTLCSAVALQSGKATCTDGQEPPGTSVVTASYEPTSEDYLPSSASLNQHTPTTGQQGPPPAEGAPSFTSPSAATFTAGTTQSLDIVATGSPTPAITASGALPSGISFVGGVDGTATIAGAPDLGTGGSYPVTLTAGNGAGPDAVQTLTLTVVTPVAGLAFTDVEGATFTCTRATPANGACTASPSQPSQPVSAKIELLGATGAPLVNTSGRPIALSVDRTAPAHRTTTAKTPVAQVDATPVIEPGASASNDAVSVPLSGSPPETLVVTTQFAGKTYTLSVGPNPVRATAVRRRRAHGHLRRDRLASRLVPRGPGPGGERPAALVGRTPSSGRTL